MNYKIMYPLWNLDKFYFKWDKQTLRIGTEDTGSWNISDPEGIWEQMIGLCNGNRTTAEIYLSITNDFPIKETVVIDALKQLAESGCLTFLMDPFIMDDWASRYKTNIAYFTSKNVNGFSIQKKLNSMKVTILGLGGGGFTILTHLVSLGVENIHVVDFDKVDLSNLSRQVVFKESDINRYKVDVGIEYCKTRNSNIKITQSKRKIENVIDAELEISNSDWVFCCLDEPAYVAQRIVNKACFNLQIPVVFGFCQKENGRTFILDPARTGCVDCLFSQISNNQFVHLVRSLKNSNFQPVTSATSVTINLLCALMIKNWLDNIIYKKNNENQIIRLDFNDFSTRSVIDFNKQENCPTCGNKSANIPQEIFDLIAID